MTANGTDLTDGFNTILKIAEVVGTLGTFSTLGLILWKGGRVIGRFEERFASHEVKISHITEKIDHMASEASERSRIDERVIAQGKRLDELTYRFNRYVNGIAEDHSER